MAETLLQFQTPVSAPDGTRYVARAVGAMFDGPTWQGWVEFVPVNGGSALRSPRETTQPNRVDIEYWATGLTPIYLDGALVRALEAEAAARPVLGGRNAEPVFSEPKNRPTESRLRHSTAMQPGTAVLDPFSVYRKGEALLRSQLMALSPWHLTNIVIDYALSSEDRMSLETRSSSSLAELIIKEVQTRASARTQA